MADGGMPVMAVSELVRTPSGERFAGAPGGHCRRWERRRMREACIPWGGRSNRRHLDRGRQSWGGIQGRRPRAVLVESTTGLRDCVSQPNDRIS